MTQALALQAANQPLGILGIDPGVSGAAALLEPQVGALEVIDLPMLSVGGKNRLDVYTLARWIDARSDRIGSVYLELVGSRPGEGHAGAFSFGRMYGSLLGIVAANFLPINDVTPAKWKADMRVRGDKDESRARAMALFPHYAELFARKKDDGRAEAVLIAAFGAKARGFAQYG